MDRDSLIAILLDPTTSDAEKDDAVIALGNNFQDDKTIDFLIQVSNDRNYDEMIAASCGESIAHIWLNKQRIDYEQVSSLSGIALTEGLSMIKAHRPDWYKNYIERYSQSMLVQKDVKVGKQDDSCSRP